MLELTAGVMVAVLIWYVLLVIANWKIFTKAGEAGWKSIIPIYNGYVLYKISWKPMWFWISLVLGVIVGICNAITKSNDIAAVAVIAVIANIANLVVTIGSLYKLSKSFGHGVGYTIGLILLNPIFTLILGFGSSQYQGADL